MTTIAAPEADPADTILSVNNIEVIYDHVILVLKGVSLSVPRGGITALLGANGAGKTTTLKAISNLLHAERGEVTKGSIVFEGEEVQALSPNDLVRRGCIQVMEGRHCFGHLSVEDNLLTGAFTRRDGAAAIRDDLELVYNYFPRLKVRRSSMAGYTSGGEQQMTAIGRALMSRWRKSSRSCASSTRSRASPSCWPSRTPISRCATPNTAIFSNRAASCSTARRARCARTRM
jgi:branched-chain amino acid transport system ATP-binding protein